MSNNKDIPHRPSVFTCSCGSGLPCHDQHDGYGFFLCRTCTKCHANKMRGYRSDIDSQYDACEDIWGDE